MGDWYKGPARNLMPPSIHLKCPAEGTKPDARNFSRGKDESIDRNETVDQDEIEDRDETDDFDDVGSIDEHHCFGHALCFTRGRSAGAAEHCW